MTRYIVIAIIIAFLSYNTSTATQYQPTPETLMQFQSDLRILDGDTFHLDNVKYRLIGINAPEIQHRKKKAECWWLNALEYLAYRLEWPVNITTVLYGVDKYDRQLVELYVDWININKELVSLWYAEPFMPTNGTMFMWYNEYIELWQQTGANWFKQRNNNCTIMVR